MCGPDPSRGAGHLRAFRTRAGDTTLRGCEPVGARPTKGRLRTTEYESAYAPVGGPPNCHGRCGTAMCAHNRNNPNSKDRMAG